MLPLPKNSSLFCQLLAGQACLSHRYVSFRYFMQIHISSFSLLNSKLNRRKHISALSRSADCQWHWKVGLSRLVRSIASAQCAVQLLTQQCRSARFGRWQRCETGSARAVRCWSPIQLQRCKKWQAWQALLCYFSLKLFLCLGCRHTAPVHLLILGMSTCTECATMPLSVHLARTAQQLYWAKHKAQKHFFVANLKSWWFTH